MKSIIIKVTCLFIIFCISNHSSAQNAPLWNGLASGPYKVGFRAEWKQDYTRTWGQSELVKESYSQRPFSRPVRLTMWFPAQVSSTSKQNKFSNYLFITATDSLSKFAESIVEWEDIGTENKGLHGLFLGNEKEYNKLLNTEVASFTNTTFIKGKLFPLIIYSLGQNDYTLENTILFEYLASYGYIVVTVPHLGMSPRKDYLLIDDALSFDTQVRDLEFSLSEMLKYPHVDAAKIGALGMSMGSVYTLLMAGKNNNIKALAGLDGTIMGGLESFAYKYQNMPYYDSCNVKVPILEIFREDHHDLSVLSSLKFSDRYLLGIKAMTHADFTASPLYTLSTARILPDTFGLARRTPEYAAAWYKIICENVRLFFDGALKNETAGSQQLTSWKSNSTFGNATSTFISGLQCPNEEEFAKIVSIKGSVSAIENLKSLQLKYPGNTWLRQKKLNRMGYEYVYKNDVNNAIELFKFNVAAFPDSSAVYASLADGYEIKGNKELAIKNYERALQLNPNDKDAKSNLERLKQ
ncbi:MAG: tetratricopeptide repeat protein [Saprospiraceae bacterium]